MTADAAHLDPLDLLRASVHARVERRRPADLDALGDLDLVAEGDPPVPRDVERERPRGRARRRVLCDRTAGHEHPRLPPGPRACDRVDAEQLVVVGQPPEVGLQRRHLLLGAQRDEHVVQSVVVHLDRELGTGDAECGEQAGLVRVWLDGRDGLLHPPEDDPSAFPLEQNGHDPAPGLEPDHLELERPAEDEGRAERRVACERHLHLGREDPDPRVRVSRRRVDEHRLREVDLARERLQPRLVELASVGEDRQLVSGQRRVGEDVADDVAEGGHAASLDTATPPP